MCCVLLCVGTHSGERAGWALSCVRSLLLCRVLSWLGCVMWLARCKPLPLRRGPRAGVGVSACCVRPDRCVSVSGACLVPLRVPPPSSSLPHGCRYNRPRGCGEHGRAVSCVCGAWAGGSREGREVLELRGQHAAEVSARAVGLGAQLLQQLRHIVLVEVLVERGAHEPTKERVRRAYLESQTPRI